MSIFIIKPTYQTSKTGDHTPRMGEDTMDGSPMLLVYTCIGDRPSQISVQESEGLRDDEQLLGYGEGQRL